MADFICEQFQSLDDALLFKDILYRSGLWFDRAGAPRTPPQSAEQVTHSMRFIFGIELDDAATDRIKNDFDQIQGIALQNQFNEAIDIAFANLRIEDADLLQVNSSLSSTGGSHSAGHSNLPLAQDEGTPSDHVAVRVVGNRRAPSGTQGNTQEGDVMTRVPAGEDLAAMVENAGAAVDAPAGNNGDEGGHFLDEFHATDDDNQQGG